MKTTLNNFQPFKICIGVHFPSRTWFPKFIKMTLRLFVILNSFTYIMLWSRFYNLCQYTPLLTAHQELQKLVLSWSFREKMSRLRLEMNVRCLKKKLATSDFRVVFVVTVCSFQKEGAFGGGIFYFQAEECFQNAVNIYKWRKPCSAFLKAFFFPLARSYILMQNLSLYRYLYLHFCTFLEVCYSL